jgi:hypothetical protein
MRRQEVRHYSEEELLMHLLEEETDAMSDAVSTHLRKCNECAAVFEEYQNLVSGINSWQIEEVAEEAWRSQKAQLMAWLSREKPQSDGSVFDSLAAVFTKGWNYALAHPLPTLGYIAIALAFASERTISVFRLDRVLPSTGEVFQILRQVL